jgi:hypothetical protein
MGQQKELRHAAAKAFIESLEHLQHTLDPLEQASVPEVACPERKQMLEIPVESPAGFDLDALEDAIADIEQYIQTHAEQKTPDPETPE